MSKKRATKVRKVRIIEAEEKEESKPEIKGTRRGFLYSSKYSLKRKKSGTTYSPKY